MTEHECCWHECTDHRGGQICCHCGEERGRHGAFTPPPKWYGGGGYFPLFNAPAVMPPVMPLDLTPKIICDALNNIVMTSCS